MRFPIARTLATSILALVALLGFLAPLSASAATTVTATEAVNVRSGPSTKNTIIGGLYRGQTVTATSEAKGWTAISYKGKRGYVSSAYLTKGKTLPTSAQVGAGQVKITTTAVNLRKGPGITEKLVVVLGKGTRVTTTGSTAKGYTQVLAGSRTGWIGSQYLTGAKSGLPTITGTRIALADLDVRTTSGKDAKTVAEIKKDSKVFITGATASGRAQVIYNKGVYWVTAKYLATGKASLPAPPPLPKVVGTRYATAVLDIRSSSADSYTAIGEIARGTIVSITGVVQNGRMQIIWNNAVRWVTAKYLSTSKPAATAAPAVEKGLQPNAIHVLHAVQVNFPQITTVYGVRQDALPDHPSGRALDLMLPDYTSATGKALGYKLSRWLQFHNQTLGVNYVIYDQQIWNVLRDQEGWRPMASRGSDTANHKDHVHVTVLADGYKPI